MGNANRLQARFADCQVWFGDLPFGNGVNAGGEGDATAFVRAHEFVLAKEEEPALAARIEHILRAGPLAQNDARRLESDQVIEVAIARAPKSLEAGQHVREICTAHRRKRVCEYVKV